MNLPFEILQIDAQFAARVQFVHGVDLVLACLRSTIWRVDRDYRPNDCFDLSRKNVSRPMWCDRFHSDSTRSICTCEKNRRIRFFGRELIGVTFQSDAISLSAGPSAAEFASMRVRIVRSARLDCDRNEWISFGIVLVERWEEVEVDVVLLLSKSATKRFDDRRQTLLKLVELWVMPLIAEQNHRFQPLMNRFDRHEE